MKQAIPSVPLIPKKTSRRFGIAVAAILGITFSNRAVVSEFENYYAPAAFLQPALGSALAAPDDAVDGRLHAV